MAKQTTSIAAIQFALLDAGGKFLRVGQHNHDGDVIVGRGLRMHDKANNFDSSDPVYIARWRWGSLQVEQHNHRGDVTVGRWLRIHG